MKTDIDEPMDALMLKIKKNVELKKIEERRANSKFYRMVDSFREKVCVFRFTVHIYTLSIFRKIRKFFVSIRQSFTNFKNREMRSTFIKRVNHVPTTKFPVTFNYVDDIDKTKKFPVRVYLEEKIERDFNADESNSSNFTIAKFR